MAGNAELPRINNCSSNDCVINADWLVQFYRQVYTCGLVLKAIVWLLAVTPVTRSLDSDVVTFVRKMHVLVLVH